MYVVCVRCVNVGKSLRLSCVQVSALALSDDPALAGAQVAPLYFHFTFTILWNTDRAKRRGEASAFVIPDEFSREKHNSHS